MKIEVGKKLVAVEDGVNSGRYNARKGLPPNHFEVEVVKVGRKYFYTTGKYGRELKWGLDDLRHDNGGYVGDYSLHESWEAYEEGRKTRIAAGKMRTKYFSGYGDMKLTMDQVERITAILEEEK